MSTFRGLEMAKQALFAQQSALYTTGHNIANANTDGYTRQRVNFETTSPFPAASRNRPEIPGQLGTGVKAGSVQRIRNQFLDYQFRTENSKSGYWETKADALARMESLLNEPSENGLAKTMDRFWQSLQDLAVNPENSGARSVVAQRGLAVAKTFNYLSDSLGGIRTDLKNQIDVTVINANSILEQINALNKQIGNIEPHGMLPNDLYDERDRLIDELSNIVSIQVTYSKSGKSSPDIADGLATIKLVDQNGKALEPAAVLVNGENETFNKLTVNYSDVTKKPDELGAVTGILVDGNTYSASEFKSIGSLTGFIESYGYLDNGTVKGIYTDMSGNLDKMAEAFATKFNDIHSDGADLNGNQGISDFFQNATGIGAAGNITVNEKILNKPELIAASNGGGSGNGGNASDLADMFDTPLNDGLGTNTSVRSFYESLIGNMGVNAQQANRMVENTTILRAQIEQQRMSVSSVSLDEEMANLIKFQHAYNAAARSMTVVDEMLNRIINNLGIVGR